MVLLKSVKNFRESEPSSFGPSLNLFYNLRIDPKNKCKSKRFMGDGKELHGSYVDGWFLCRFDDAVVVCCHRKRGDSNNSLILCAKTFGDLECPACESYNSARDRKNHPHGANEDRIILPFLSTTHQEEPNIQKGKWQILPIYWFEMNVTRYREDYYENLNRLSNANDKNPIHRVPYRIYARDRGERQIQEYYFAPLKESEKHEITTEHPIIDDWLCPKTGKWKWNKDYRELLTNMSIVRFRPYQTDDGPYDYEGHYSEAEQYVRELMDVYPNPRTEVEGYEEEDDAEELD